MMQSQTAWRRTNYAEAAATRVCVENRGTIQDTKDTREPMMHSRGW